MDKFIMKASTKALTIIELVLSLALASILLLGASQLIISQCGFSNTQRVTISLSQEAVYVVEDIAAKVRNSKYVQIGADGLSLAIYNAGNSLIGTYTWPATAPNNLYYTPNGGTQSLVSNKLTTLVISPLGSGNTALKLIQISATVADPKYPNIGARSSTSNASCRLPGIPYPVRLVDSSESTVKGYYVDIQSAINASTTAGDVVQVSSNDGALYGGVSIQSKSIILKGRYDYNNWTRHTADSAYETIISAYSANPAVFYNCTVAGSNTIDDFTVINGNGTVYPGGIYVSIATNCTLTISNNIIKQNVVGINAPGISSGATLNITNNTITGNSITGNASTGIAGGIMLAGNGYTATIQKNSITQNTATALINSCCCAGGINCIATPNTTLNIVNNTVANNSSTTVGPLYYYAHTAGGIFINKDPVATITVANNNITGNSVTGPSNCDAYGGGITILVINESQANYDNPLTFSNNIISNNNITTGGPINYGGGAYISILGGTANSINPSNIVNNSITNNTIIGTGSNFSASGAGIYAASLSHSKLNITNNTISQNTISSSSGTGYCYGAGLYSSLNSSTQYITNNSITGNGLNAAGTSLGAYGGGMTVWSSLGSSAYITLNVVRGNSLKGGTLYGCGVCTADVSSVINNIITGNTLNGSNSSYGGGVYLICNNYSPVFANNTIVGNTISTPGLGGGVFPQYLPLTIINSIIYDNSAKNIETVGTVTVNYSDVGGTGGAYSGTGTNNKNIAPVFVSKTTDDYHLQNVAGNNYIIDGGNPNASYNDAMPPGLRTVWNDMGAYGGPGAKNVIGFDSTNLVDDSSTPLIREDIIGTY